MALEFTRARAGGRSDRDRSVASERGDDEAGGQAGWVSVAEAASLAGVSTGTVRQWYRAGLLATQRRVGERGGFLVRASDVMDLAGSGDGTVFDIDDSYWASEADDARSEVRRLTAEIADLQGQIEAAREPLREARAEAATARQTAAAAERAAEALRSRLAESLQQNAGLAATVDELRSHLHDARRAATFGSVTSTEWADELDATYRGPQRPQDPISDATVAVMAPLEQPLRSDDAPNSGDDDFIAMLAGGSSRLVYGDAADDLLPEVEEKRGRRRTRR